MSIIDLTDHLEDIRQRFPQWWRSDEALRELQALWGYADCNQHGVLETNETLRIDLESQKQWHGVVRIAQAPNGWHAVSTDYSYALGGGGSAPSVWNRLAFTTREEAIEAGIRTLIATFEGIRDWKGYAPEKQASLAARMIERLYEELRQTRQLELFG